MKLSEQKNKLLELLRDLFSIKNSNKLTISRKMLKEYGIEIENDNPNDIFWDICKNLKNEEILIDFESPSFLVDKKYLTKYLDYTDIIMLNQLQTEKENLRKNLFIFNVIDKTNRINQIKEIDKQINDIEEKVDLKYLFTINPENIEKIFNKNITIHKVKYDSINSILYINDKRIDFTIDGNEDRVLKIIFSNPKEVFTYRKMLNSFDPNQERDDITSKTITDAMYQIKLKLEKNGGTDIFTYPRKGQVQISKFYEVS
jgi:hypothetical protein